jgi:Tfp pilus assembly protein PilF
MAEDIWTLAAAADVAAASGLVDEALQSYRRALRLPGANMALHLSYADFLLELGEARKAMDALASLSPADAVLLRRAIAAKRIGSPGYAALRSEYRERQTVASRLGSDGLHLRERAISALHLDADPAAALEFARRNWEQQKGWEDAAIFLKAASAAGRPDAASAVSDWRAHFRHENG